MMQMWCVSFFSSLRHCNWNRHYKNNSIVRYHGHYATATVPTEELIIFGSIFSRGRDRNAVHKYRHGNAILPGGVQIGKSGYEEGRGCAGWQIFDQCAEEFTTTVW